MDELLKKLEELQGKLDKAVASGESITELRSEIKKLQEDAVAMKAEMGDLKKATPSKVTSIPGLEIEKDKFSLLRAVNAIVTHNWQNAGFEREVFQNTAKGNRDGITKATTLSTETDSAGGYVVPVQVLGDFIELLRANLITSALGATYIDGLVGSPVEMPGQAGGATAGWLGEDNTTGLTQTDLSLRQSQMMPHMCGAIVKMSNRLLRMSNPSIEAMVRKDVAFAMASAIDLAAINGDGSDAQPLGIKNISGVLTEDLIGITKKVGIWSAMYDIEGKLDEANALRGNLGWAFHPRVKRYLSQARVGSGYAAEDSAGDYVKDPITQAQLQSLIGYPFKTSTNLSITTSTTPDEMEMIFGNWSELIIGVWQGLSILASQEASTAFATNQTWVRFVQEVDCMVRHKESFCIGQHLSAALTV